MSKYLLLLFVLINTNLFCQTIDPTISNETKKTQFQMGVNVGYDIPVSNVTLPFYSTDPGLKFGLNLDFYFNKLGLGLDLDLINNTTSSTIGATVFYNNSLTQRAETINQNESLSRNFIGLGPSFRTSLGNKIDFMIYLRAGYSTIKGGEFITTTVDPNASAITNHHLLVAGYDAGSFSTKAGLNLDFKINSSLSLSLGAYHLRHFTNHLDDTFELNNTGAIGIYYGHSNFDENGSSLIYNSNKSDYVISIDDPNEKSPCNPFTSFGINLGFKYTFGESQKNKKLKDKNASALIPKTSSNKAMISVKDQQSGLPIPNAKVLLKNKNGDLVASGMTDGDGLVELTNLLNSDYTIEGIISGISTSTAKIDRNEFENNTVVNKEIYYTALSFILKGTVVNNNSKTLEPGVLINLTNTSTGKLSQVSTDERGNFSIQLDKSSSYSIVGVKKNKLSNVGRASTVGLNRSTTLFVNLELGIENFNCGQETLIDINYAFDKADILDESKFVLDKLVRYLLAHQISKVELLSHTDSRGSNAYNQDLSQRRAQSAVNYIVSKGVNASRIIAKGYGETLLKNKCADGVKCSEDEHSENRRTEAKLICQ